MRRIPSALAALLESPTPCPCRLLRITLADGRIFGLTTLDQAVDYRGVTYSALHGFDCSVIASDTGVSVDNAEATALFAATVAGIEPSLVARGELDGATWEMLLIDWSNPAAGHVTLDAGDLGEVKVIDGMVYVPELLSYTVRLRQPVGGVWSRRCRATFGTAANGSAGCGVDAAAMWAAATVTGVDTDDPFRVFSATGLVGAAYTTGRVQWLTGDNAGSRVGTVEAFGGESGTVALFEALVFPVQLGDTFQIRADCNKSPSDCTAYGNFLNYKGEPFIPVGDGLETMTPGAQTFGGLSGSEITG
ncbi:hypothetical protein D3C78_445610 [compost metagenome]